MWKLGRMSVLLFGLIMVSFMVVACSNSSENGNASATTYPVETTKATATQPAKTAEPKAEASAEPVYSIDKIDEKVTIKVLQFGGGPNETFTETWVNPVQKKFPNVTIEVQNWIPIPERVVSGDFPDIFVGRDNLMPSVLNAGLEMDISPLIKKYNYDLSRVNPQMVQKAKNSAGGDILPGLPTGAIPNAALYYNKEVFDLMGENYPKDGMTWDEVYDLALKMTKKVNGTQYYGFLDRWRQTMFIEPSQMHGISPLKNNEDVADLSDPFWGKLMANFYRFYSMPGMEWTGPTLDTEKVWLMWPTDQNVAMAILPQPALRRAATFPWDLVTAPTFPENNGVNTIPDGGFAFLMNTTKHPDEAFKIIAYLTSEEYQKGIVERGQLPIIDAPGLLDNFGIEAPELQGKHVESYFLGKVANPLPPRAPGLSPSLANQSYNIIKKHAERMILEGIDANTALREAEEEINAVARAAAVQK